jgi:hypothetical protein
VRDLDMHYPRVRHIHVNKVTQDGNKFDFRFPPRSGRRLRSALRKVVIPYGRFATRCVNNPEERRSHSCVSVFPGTVQNARTLYCTSHTPSAAHCCTIASSVNGRMFAVEM